MQGLTIAIAVAAAILTLTLKPKFWPIVYVASLAYYPSYLTIKLGSLDFNVTRVLVMLMLTLVLFNQEYTKQFKMILLDKLVIAVMVCQLFVSVFTTPFSMILENRAGAMLDSVMPYFLIRLTINEWKSYLTLLKYVLIMMVPLAILGTYQSITSHNPVGFFAKYSAWGSGVEVFQEPRHGFYRANITFPMSIMFGLFFAMLGPSCFGLLKTVKKDKKPILYIALGFALLGAMSSMSSGPWMAMTFSLAFMLFYKYRKNWKIVLWCFILGCIAVETISNRHFYDVLGRFTFSSSTAWYRTRLFEVAFFEGGMKDHWLFGYGLLDDPGWGKVIDYRNFTDMVNHYLLVLARYGLIGFIPFIMMIIEGIKQLIKTFKAAVFEQERWLIWCFAGGLFGLLSALNTVSLFGQPSIILYLLLGFCGCFMKMTSNMPRRETISQNAIRNQNG